MEGKLKRMIYTVTLNPSLDYVVQVPGFISGSVNRASYEALYPGGKGINVSLVLKNLGYDSRALGFTAGFTGRELERLLKELDCQTAFVRLSDGMTRINVKIRSDQESEINGQGPRITSEAQEQLLGQLDELKDGDTLVLAGSIPSTLSADTYERILERVSTKAVQTVVDAAGELLQRVLPHRPFLIKPNNHELSELFGQTLASDAEIRDAAKQLQEQGARNVLVSMADEGALLLTEQGSVYRAQPPKGRAVNSVGAGDSMVAGFLSGWLRTGDYRAAFAWGIAAGSATAFQERLAQKEDVLRLLPLVHPEQL